MGSGLVCITPTLRLASGARRFFGDFRPAATLALESVTGVTGIVTYFQNVEYATVPGFSDRRVVRCCPSSVLGWPTGLGLRVTA
jgi:hypothetical protein